MAHDIMFEKQLFFDFIVRKVPELAGTRKNPSNTVFLYSIYTFWFIFWRPVRPA